MRLWDFGRLRENRVRIGERIGRPLGLVDGSQVFSTMFRYDHNGSRSYEIVLSTFGPENYRRICQATFYMIDVPGACAQISRFMGDRNIDILNSVSLSMISNVCMVWKMLVDLSYYGDHDELLSEFQRLKSERDPSLDKIDVLEISPSNISDRYTKGVAPESSSVRTRVVRRMHRTPSMIVNGEFEIPKEYIDLLDDLRKDHPLMLVGDTDSWVLSITLLKPETRLIDLEFIIPDRPGAIQKVTEFLARYDINLLMVYTKVLVYYEKMTLEVVADVSGCPVDLEELKRETETFLMGLRGGYGLAQMEPIDF